MAASAACKLLDKLSAKRLLDSVDTFLTDCDGSLQIFAVNITLLAFVSAIKWFAIVTQCLPCGGVVLQQSCPSCFKREFHIGPHTYTWHSSDSRQVFRANSSASKIFLCAIIG